MQPKYKKHANAPLAHFPFIVKKAVKNPPMALEVRPCPDQVVGTLGALKINGRITSRTPISDRPSQSAVIMVLESPHISEFTSEIGPAKGITGTLIAKYAHSVKGIDGSKGDTSLLLMNAIQHQCSLGMDTSLYRDDVFHAAWNDFGKAHFVARLKAAYQPNDLVVCACTKGSSNKGGPSLRQLVYAAMVEALPAGTRILRRTHPSSWFAKKNLIHEWS